MQNSLKVSKLQAVYTVALYKSMGWSCYLDVL